MISRAGMYNHAAAAVASFGTNTSTTRGSENLFVGGIGNDSVNNDTDSSIILTGAGNDTVVSTGNKNTIEDTSGTNIMTVIGDENKVKGGTGSDSIAIIGDKNTVVAGNGTNKIALLGDRNNITTGTDTDYIYTLDFAIRNNLFSNLSGYLADYAKEIKNGLHIDGLISNTKITDLGGYNHVGLNVADGLTDININKANNDYEITSGADWIK